MYMSDLYLVTRDLTLAREWSFFTSSDPTHGNVNYLSEQDAVFQRLAYVNITDNTLVLAVDSTSTVPPGGNRDS